MNEQVKIKVLEIFNKLADAELSFAELYTTCGQCWTQDTEFWFGMAQEEQNHARKVKQMRELVSQSPNEYTQEKSFNPITLITAGQMAIRIIQKIDSSLVSHKEIFNIALDIEKSILETNYMKILKTDNIQYLDLAKEIVLESEKHKALIEQKIEEAYRSNYSSQG